MSTRVCGLFFFLFFFWNQETYVTKVGYRSTSSSLSSFWIVFTWIWKDRSVDRRFEFVVWPTRENISAGNDFLRSGYIEVTRSRENHLTCWWRTCQASVRLKPIDHLDQLLRDLQLNLAKAVWPVLMVWFQVVGESTIRIKRNREVRDRSSLQYRNLYDFRS